MFASQPFGSWCSHPTTRGSKLRQWWTICCGKSRRRWLGALTPAVTPVRRDMVLLDIDVSLFDNSNTSAELGPSRSTRSGKLRFTKNAPVSRPN
jgi:hypothetical protein